MTYAKRRGKLLMHTNLNTSPSIKLKKSEPDWLTISVLLGGRQKCAGQINEVKSVAEVAKELKS